MKIHDFMIFDYQYFTKVIRIPENRGAGVRPHPCFRASLGFFRVLLII